MSYNPKTQTMTAGEAVVDGLIRNGIDTLFCLPGIQNDLFFDALHARTDEIRPIHTRHEQAVAYMALGGAGDRQTLRILCCTGTGIPECSNRISNRI